MISQIEMDETFVIKIEIALIELRQLQDQWYLDVIEDMRCVAASMSISVCNGSSGLFLKCTGQWSDAGEYLCAQNYHVLYF